MDLERLERTWDRLGKQDPLWAVLTHPEKKGGRWDLSEFLATGEAEIDELLTSIEERGFHPLRDVAVDFGCGVGRLTQPLAQRFQTVYGIDIAPSMIAKARELNRHGDACRYVVNTHTSLPLETASADFVCSNIVLQHMEPRYSRNYIVEFLRVLRPGGIAVFQTPDRLVQAAPGQERPQTWARTPARIWRVLSQRLRRGEKLLTGLGEPRIEMYGMSPEDVSSLVEAHGGRVADVSESSHAGPDWIAYQYIIQNRHA